MLQALRKGTASWIAKIFIGMLVLSFAVWGVADIFGGYGRRTVATVGDTKIGYDDFRSALNTQMQAFGRQLGRTLSLDEARALGIDQRVLESLIQKAALQNQAAAMKLGISDRAIVERITREPVFRDATGKFSKTIFEQLLAANGLSEGRFVAQQRDSYVRQQLVRTVGGAIELPKALLRAADIYQNETRRLKYFILPASKLDPVSEPTAEALQKFYDGRKSSYSIPEFRKIGVLALSPVEVGKQLTVNDDDLKAYYEANKGEYHTPEKRLVRQIPFTDAAEAQTAYDKIQAGTGFDDLASERGLSAEDTRLGVVAEADLADKIIAAAAFALEKDRVSQPVQGQLSTVLLLVPEIQPGKTTPFNEAKGDIRAKLATDRAIDEIHELHNRIEDERANGATLREAAKTLNLPYVTIDAVNRNGKGKDGKDITGVPEKDQVLREAFLGEPGLEIDPVETEDQGLVWFEILEIMPSTIKPFATVREEVAADWKDREERSKLVKTGQELVGRARKGENLDEIAKAFELEVKLSEPVKRDASHKELSRPAITLAFALSKGGYGAAASDDQRQRIVFQVEAVEQPGALGAEAADALKAKFSGQVAEDLVTQYVTGLSEAYGVARNQPLINELTGRTDLASGQR